VKKFPFSTDHFAAQHNDIVQQEKTKRMIIMDYRPFLTKGGAITEDRLNDLALPFFNYWSSLVEEVSIIS
jgi:hypothetical protein